MSRLKIYSVNINLQTVSKSWSGLGLILRPDNCQTDTQKRFGTDRDHQTNLDTQY